MAEITLVKNKMQETKPLLQKVKENAKQIDFHASNFNFAY